jgi:tripartite-type tricarboxylate transporter receptor subunit TctC
MQHRSFLFAIALSIVASAAAQAGPVADFYKGKQIQFIIRTGPGGGYDQYSRLLARYIGNHIPGNPTVIPVNMPGGGGIVAANYVANVAPKDGTILTMTSNGLPTDQALELNKSLKADLRTFNWIGNMGGSNQVLVVWYTSKTKNLADAKQRQTIFGTTGAGSITVQLPALYNNILGTKFKIIFGYPDGAWPTAMESGEIEASNNAWSTYKTFATQYVEEKKIVPIIQAGLKKEPDLPDVPLLIDQAANPQDHAVLDYMSRSVGVGRPVATTPGVPADRVAALRKAFDDTFKDPDFLSDVAAQKADVRYMSGSDLAKLVGSLIDAPQDLRDRVKQAIQPNNAEEFKGAKKKSGAD